MDDEEQPMTIQSMKGSLKAHRPEGESPYGSIYDMVSYAKKTQMIPNNRENPPKRNFRPRQRLLRPGLEGYRRIDNLEERVSPMDTLEIRENQMLIDNEMSDGPEVKLTESNGLPRAE